jgi:hypothetical protein
MKILKNKLSHIPAFLIAFNLIILTSPAAGADTNSLFNLRIILPGMTETITINQEGLFPLGTPHFFINVLGTGTLGISLRKHDVSGDILFMAGLAQSEAGTFPIYRVGVSKGMVDQIVEIGDANKPFGFVWLYCGVMFSDNNPIYTYDLRLSLAP